METILAFEQQGKANGFFHSNRKEQDKFWLKETLSEIILRNFYDNKILLHQLHEMEIAISKGRETSFSAAEKLYWGYIRELLERGNG
jgi:putative protein kinase ArgK-like GTPase of G3E family